MMAFGMEAVLGTRGLHEKGEMRDGWGSCAHAIMIIRSGTLIDTQTCRDSA